MAIKLIADSGATKCEWCLINNGKKKTLFTMGISPYFLNEVEIVEMLKKDLLPRLKKVPIKEVHFYGTGLSNPHNVVIVKKALSALFHGAKVLVNTDMLAAARALCGSDKGMACILGTGSNSCFYNGKKITKIRPGIGYALGDEGSGAYLGKRVIQYYLYDTFDEELKARFTSKYHTSSVEVLENVYKKPLPNRYLAGFAIFLAENRGHYMVENIIEDGLNDFFYHHLVKFRESWTHPIHFIGSIAFGFKDVLQDLCSAYELELGRVMQKPMNGLVKFHSNQ